MNLTAPRAAAFLGFAALVLGAPRPLGQLVAAQGGDAPPLTIDFLALGKDGAPVRDLKPEDVSIKIDGKARTIKSFTLVTVPDSGTSGAAADAGANGPAGDALPAPYGTNVTSGAGGGRSFVLLVEDETLRPGNETAMRDAVGRFLAALSPQDRVMVVTAPHGGIRADFTTDKQKVRDAMNGITGQAAQSENADDATCRSRSTLNAVTGTLEGVANLGQVTVVVFSSSLMGARQSTTPTSRGRTSSSGGANACELLPDEFQAAGAAAAAAHATVYIVEHDMAVNGATPTGNSSTTRGLDSPSAGLENLAGVTGGRVFPLASAGDTALVQVATETSAYYVATVSSESGERNGSTHQLNLKINRDGVTARNTPDVFIPKMESAGGKGGAAATTPEKMLADNRSYVDLPLRGVGLVSRGDGGKMKVIVAMEPVDPAVTITAASTGLVDASSKMSRSTISSDALKSRPIISAMSIAPGHYRLRMAAVDSNGRGGAVDYDLDATLTPAGPLQISALAIGVMDASQHFVPKLQFGKDDKVAVLYAEIYGQVPAGQAPEASIEISKSLHGESNTLAKGPAGKSSEPDRFIVTGGIPVDQIEDGDYVIKITAGLPGQPQGQVVRTFRKVTK